MEFKSYGIFFMNINLQQQLKILLSSSLNIKLASTGLNCSEEGNPVSFMASKSSNTTEAGYQMEPEVRMWLNMLISSMPKATLITDSGRFIQLTNQQFCDIFHLSKTPEQLTGYNTADLVNDIAGNIHDILGFTSKTLEIYNNRQPLDNDEIHLKDGRIIMRDHRPLYLKEQFIGHLWTFSDETERIRGADSINKQRNFYETILDNIPADIAVFSSDHRYRFVNPVGVKDPVLRKWLIGKTDADYCVFRNKSMSIAEGRRALFNQVVSTGKEYTWEEKVVNRNNEDEYHLRKMSPVFNEAGELDMLIGYGIDVTELKNIERQVQLSEKKYKDLFNYSQAIICTHDLEGNLLEVNPMLCQMLEKSESDLTGKNLRQFLPEQDQGIFDDTYLPTIQNNNRAKGLFRVISGSGRSVYLLYQNYKMVPDNPDQQPYVIAFAQDVTDRIKAEKQLKEAKKLTEETAKIKEKFLANMSHEISSPMRSIQELAGDMLVDASLTQDQFQSLQSIHRWSEHILTIVSDILDLEQATEGNLELEEVNFDLVKVIQSAIAPYREIAASKKLELVFDNHLTSSYKVVGDPARLTQVADNLLSNAIKFTHTGIIIIRADIEKETPKAVTLHLSVKDTGIGIAEDKLIKIFQPFAQAHESTDRKYRGTGLGLTLTKKLVGLQHGSIWVESQPRKGSTFHVQITYQKPLAPGIHKPVAITNNTPGNLGKLKILLAEDSEISQLLARSVLQYWGFESKTASNGEEVIQMLEQEDFDLILMDIQMPRKNGVEATMEIRNMSNERKRNVPIIALTATSMKGEEQKFLSSGMNDYITKPFKEQELYNVISRVYYSVIRD
ncbi:ATP-binding protein [Filimonas effusa]|uniref:histidine kinase n=1 Tax=Filimonas effusa TaxID=2508721 RepID=A0A4Q1D5Y3_9BACT|nr:ATP-binding protein [Filimonas effusa]RXK83047.1 response regulator [Filimonas effusa]